MLAAASEPNNEVKSKRQLPFQLCFKASGREEQCPLVPLTALCTPGLFPVGLNPAKEMTESIIPPTSPLHPPSPPSFFPCAVSSCFPALGPLSHFHRLPTCKCVNQNLSESHLFQEAAYPVWKVYVFLILKGIQCTGKTHFPPPLETQQHLISSQFPLCLEEGCNHSNYTSEHNSALQESLAVLYLEPEHSHFASLSFGPTKFCRESSGPKGAAFPAQYMLLQCGRRDGCTVTRHVLSQCGEM